MENIVKTYLENKNLLSANKSIIVGFSGGFDSMALADILIKLSKTYKIKIILAHLNHNWRGEKSLSEARNCENFAKNFNVEFYTETLSDNVPNTETAAREARYNFFDKTAKIYNSSIILTAHTQSDNIETILQRIIKGTGITGLKGISDTRQLNKATVYRPLLSCSREDILNYCKINNLSPNDDNSNTDTKYLRNRIRHNLLPDLKENYDKNIEKALIRLIQNANEEEEILEKYTSQIFKKIIKEDEFDTQNFLKLNMPLQKRFIKQEILEKLNFDYNQKRINEILDFIIQNNSSKSGTTLSIGKNQWLFLNNNIFKIITNVDYNSKIIQIPLNIDGETCIKDYNAIIRVTKWTDKIPESFPDSNSSTIYVDLSQIELPLIVRNRIDGDIITPFGKNSPVKLKKYLNNNKISKHEKSKLLLTSSKKEVLWVINLGISNNIRVKKNGMPTHKIEYIRSEKDGQFNT